VKIVRQYGEMAKQTTTFDEAVSVASGLSPLDKVRLMERLAAMLEDDLSVAAGESPESLEETLPRRLTFKELAAWLDANPPDEPWGDLKDDEDAGDYVHRMRRQAAIWLDEPGEHE
jgi:hypothetical protein